MSANTYSAKEHSYTRDIDYTVQVSRDYLHKGERVLSLDDFLANGVARKSLINICNQAGTEIVDCGLVTGKVYQQV